ncbi:hypothetical protein ACWGNZ_07175 [Sphingomonas zeae]
MDNWLDPIFAPWDGNASAMAGDIGLPYITVQQWRTRGSIPVGHWANIIGKAADRGCTLVYEDFIHPEKRVAPAATA